MERLTFGHGRTAPQAEVPELRAAAPVPEREVPPIVADPLPGESSDWAFFGLLAFTAMLFFRPQDQLPVLASLHLAEASALVGLGAMLAKRMARGLVLARVPTEVLGLFAFGAAMVFSTPFSFWPGGSVEVLTGLYAKVLLIVVLMVNSITTPRRLQRFSWLIVLASTYLAGRAVFDYARGENLIENGRVAGAVHGIFGNPNDLALNMVAFLPLAVLFALPARRWIRLRHSSVSGAGAVAGVRRRRPSERGGRLRASVAGAAALLMVMAVVFTKSRSGALGMVAMGIVLVAYGRRIRPGLGALAIVMVVVAVPALPSSFWSRMTSIVEPSRDDTGSREARRTVMREAASVFLERPLTGIGPGQFKNYNPPGRQERWREAHNVWLQVASETGVPGLLTFLFLVASAFRGALGTRRRLAALQRGPAAATLGPAASRDVRILQTHSTALVASLAGWFVCSMFASVAYNWTFYYLLGLCIATRELAIPHVPAGGHVRANALASRAAPPALARG